MKTKTVNQKGKIWLKNKMHSYRASVFLLTILAVFSTVLSLAFAYMVRYLINSASNGLNQLLWLLSAVLLGLLLFKICIKTIESFYAERIRAKMIAELRTKTFSKILKSQYAQVTTYHSGELLNRITSDVNEVAVDTVGLMPSLVGMSVQCLGAVVALLTIDPWFTLLYVVCGGAFGCIAAFFRKYIKKNHKAVMQTDGEHRAFMQEGLSSVMTIKAYSAEDKTTQKNSVFADNYYKARMKRNNVRVGMNAVFNLLSNSGLIIAIIWGGISILKNGSNADYGAILSVILLLMQFQQPLTSFSAVIPAYYSRLASGERLAEIEELTYDESTTVKNVTTTFSQITFDNIDFSYGREPIFSNANFTLERETISCLTGASGAGKSTIFKLLLQVFQPTNGNINVCSENEITPLTAAHRTLFAYVPQGNFLFSGTIYENLTFFCNEENIKEDNIQNALSVACADFVNDLPDGLQTALIERGGGLSEGQLQRLAIARAILSDRPILLLDEATSALDNETEQKLLANIKNLKNKTCLIVTHRPAALAIADKVWLVENGKIVES